MDAITNVNQVLNYALFRVASSNRYDTVIYAHGKSERLASGSLDELALHLPGARRVRRDASEESFRLQVIGSPKEALWFNKSTLARFLHLVNSPEILKRAQAIENEISQLDESRRFHLNLYSKDNPRHRGDVLQGDGLTHTLQLDESSSNATKRELLRALEFRIAALKEEFISCFNQAAGAICFTQQISELVSFARHFGAEDLRILLTNYLPWCPKDQATLSTNNDSQETLRTITDSFSRANIVDPEIQSTTGSDDSTDSSGGGRVSGERSRPIIRSASPRRSASPMRRIQIGRSGSRRSTALSIKSLSYFPTRERISMNQDANASNSDDEEPQAVTKKPDNSVRRMSVQDAISLFEGKQKDQNLDIHKRRASGDVSTGTGKSVLRRWSAGMGNSFNRSSQGSAPVAVADDEEKEAEVKVDLDFSANGSEADGIQLGSSPAAEKTMNNGNDEAICDTVEVSGQTVVAAEWNRQKEAELNKMLMEMMETKPTKYQTQKDKEDTPPDRSNKPRGDFYVQYKEKRDERLRSESVKKREAKAAQFKEMREALEQSKADMASKSSGGLKGKQDPPAQPQKPRRNSSPPLISRKDLLKPTGPKKTTQKSSPSPAVRTPSSAGQLLKTVGTPASRSSSGLSSTGTTPMLKKPQSAPPSTRPSPRTERQTQPNTKKGAPTVAKPETKGHVERQLTSSRKAVKGARPANVTVSQDDPGLIPVKPSFYNKVTKKSSVVPLETKPFLKKGSGAGAGVAPCLARTKVFHSDEPLKNCENFMEIDSMGSATCAADETIKMKDGSVQVHDDTVTKVEAPPENVSGLADAKGQDPTSDPAIDSVDKASQVPAEDVRSGEDTGITSAAWVEVETQEVPPICDAEWPEDAVSPEIACQLSSLSPRVHHSLSQMLQADNSEPEIIEWGNAENPPLLVYQRDSPKGLKRLLKFARKSKGDANAADFEAEDDHGDPRAASKKNSDAKGYGQQKTVLHESYDGGSSSKRSMDHQNTMHDLFSVSAQSGTGNGQRGNPAAAATNGSKTSRSFFSLSTFRSGSKSSESKLR